MSRILVGTASWTDPTLISCRRFYPPSAASSEARLKYYASQFPLVEVDSTYYSMPSAHNATLWAQRTPPGFLFDVKVFRLFTHHQTQPKFLPPAVRDALGESGSRNIYYDELPAQLKSLMWHEFTEGLKPLTDAGKLGALLFQFPHWFVMRRASFGHIHEIRRHLASYTIAIEFRHESWFDSQRHRHATLALERELEISNVTVDEPQGLPGSIPTVWDMTNEKLAIFRLHGRNASTWNKRDLASAAERFDYDYSQQELGTFVPHLRALAAQSHEVHVVFNVNKADQGVRGARSMLDLLQIDEPAPGESGARVDDDMQTHAGDSTP
jgi:uncharacterized protein YecE (DUF72 family)